MTDVANQTALSHASALLVYYSFDLYGYTANETIKRWVSNFQAAWVRLAVIEALYQGRYKGISVEQILAFWQRRGQPVCHFNHEFERLVCSRLPEYPLSIPDLGDNSLTAPEVELVVEDAEREMTVTEVPVLKTAIELPPTTPSPKPDLASSSSEADANPTYQVDWTRCEVGKHPIRQFVPASEDSEFYAKLQAVAKSSTSDSEASVPID